VSDVTDEPATKRKPGRPRGPNYKPKVYLPDGTVGRRGATTRVRVAADFSSKFDPTKGDLEPAEEAGPLLRWAGGKGRIADKIIERFPKRCATYIEPFAGGAAVFWAYRAQAEKAILADANADLMNLYRQVQDSPRAVQINAQKHADADCQSYYMQIRARFNDDRTAEKLSPQLRAAMMLYLNRACFNGLWRVNRSGKYNVPWGKLKKPAVPSSQDFVDCWRALQGVELLSQHFVGTIARAGAGDVVYCDPPYPGTFDMYAIPQFGESEHRQLALCCYMAAARGARVFVSTSDHPLSHELYPYGVAPSPQATATIRTRIERIDVRHQVGPTAAERKVKSELLVSLTKE
jgi:DNA adenine methylase Dam